MSPKVSVIMPVYNTGSFLDRSIASALTQTLTDIEIICIDDGSDDDSPEIIRTWASRDSRIRCVHFKDHKGVCIARNAGIEAALGEWIYFLDSDDWTDPDYLEVMLDRASRTGQDIVVNASIIKEYDDPALSHVNEVSSVFGGGDGYYDPSLVQSRIPTALWTRLYRRSYLLDNELDFPEDVAGAEDIFFTSVAEALQPRSYVFRGPYYHYYQRSGSLIHDTQFPFLCLKSCHAMCRTLMDRGVSLDGLKLYWSLPGLIIDTEEKFSFLYGFFSRIEAWVRRFRDLYTLHDFLLFEAVLSCVDFRTFKSRYGFNVGISFIRQARKESQGTATVRVSVIVPVYNSAGSLGRCLRSILGQSLSEMEVICIDDASTDSSLEILKGYAATDHRVKILGFTSNRGVSAARNAGLEAAAGDYVFFMDSDDWIEADHLEKMWECAVSTSLNVVINANYVKEGNVSSERHPSGGLSLGYHSASDVQAFFFPTVWTRLYRRSFLLRSGIRFPESLRSSEDVYFTSLCDVLSRFGYIFMGGRYHYSVREGSLSRSEGNDFQHIRSYRLLHEELTRRGLPLSGLKLFYAGSQTVSSQPVFDMLKQYLSAIRGQVEDNPRSYNDYDRYFLAAICSSGDWNDFRSKYGRHLAFSFIRASREPREQGYSPTPWPTIF